MLNSLLKWTFLLAGSLCLVTGCSPSHEDSSATNDATSQMNSDKSTNQPEGEEARRAALQDALKQSAKMADDKLHGIPPLPSQFAFPNFGTGPHLPSPIGINFYTMNDRYPDYLLCSYDVSEKHYDKDNEPEWFAAALLQIRGKGRSEFPPVKWVAVIIFNRAEENSANTMEQSAKAGAVFKADDVFELDDNVEDLVARAKVDRHPFKYDSQQPTPGEQQRWIIVEQHAVTKSP